MENKPKHTPTTWTWKTIGDSCMLISGPVKVLIHHAAWSIDDRDKALIAAAPELLAVARLVAQHIKEGNCTEDDEIVISARAAIAKAEGK